MIKRRIVEYREFLPYMLEYCVELLHCRLIVSGTGQGVEVSAGQVPDPRE